MDFSQFNGGEQATMTKVIEKKQASQLLHRALFSSYLASHWIDRSSIRTSQCTGISAAWETSIRCQISMDAI